jgi:hypothetical protein
MHTGVVKAEGETGKFRTPLAKFKTLVNKNAIKPEIRGPPGNFP